MERDYAQSVQAKYTAEFGAPPGDSTISLILDDDPASFIEQIKALEESTLLQMQLSEKEPGKTSSVELRPKNLQQ